MSTYFAGSYWGDRPVTAGEAAATLTGWLTTLAGLHPALARWGTKGMSPTDGTPVPARTPVLAELLLAGRSRRDTTNEVMPELGFRVALWNGDLSVPVSFHAQCGIHAGVPAICNSAGISLPTYAEAPGLTGPGLVSAAMHATIEAWRPDSALYIGTGDRARQAKENLDPRLGWYTYRADPNWIDTTQLPPQVRTEAIADGLAVLAGPDPVTADHELLGRIRAAIQD